MSDVLRMEDLEALQRQIDEINKRDIRTVQMSRNNELVLITPEQREQMHFMGLTTFALLKDFAVVDPTAV